MVYEIFSFFGLLILSLVLLYATGIIISCFFREKTLIHEYLFLKLSSAILIWVFMISIVTTKLNTIFVFLIIPIAIIVYLNRSEISFKFKINTKTLIVELSVLLGFTILAFLTNLVFVFDNDLLFYVNQHPDYYWYAQYSAGLAAGNENYLGNSNLILLSEYKGLNPYHYFELWLNFIIAKFRSTSNLLTLLLVTYPLLQTVALMGIYNIAKKLINIKHPTIIVFCLSFLIIYAAPLYFSFYENTELLKYSSGICHTSPMNFGKKYSPIYIFSFVALFLLSTKNTKESLIVLAFIPLLSIGTLPAIAMGLFIYFFIQYILTKKKNNIIYSLLSVLPSVIILIFYKWNTIHLAENIVNAENLLSHINNYGGSIVLFKNVVFRTIFPIFRVLILFSPFSIICLIYFRKNKNRIDQQLLIFSGILILCGAITSTIAFNLPDSGQLLYNIIPIVNCIIIFIVIKSLNYTSKLAYLIIFLLCVYNFSIESKYLFQQQKQYEKGTIQFTDKFKRGILNELSSSKNPKIAYLYESDSLYLNYDFELSQSPLLFTSFIKSDPIYICINTPSNKLNYSMSLYNSFFYFRSKKLSYKEKEIKSQFLSKLSFTHLLLPKNKTADDFNVNLTLKFIDDSTGYKFYRIDMLN